MTINQALDKLSENKKQNLEQQDLKLSLNNLKQKVGGRTKIENVKEVENIIKHGNKEGDDVT